MRRNPRFFRLTATVALTALLWDSILPLAAVAQPAPPPLPPAPGQPTQNQADPPVRVGRVAGITGTVSFHNQGDTQWSPASVNYPVSSGNAFWTEPTAEAQLEVSDSRLALAGGSELDIYMLDATGLQAVAVQGEAYFHLRDLAPNEAWSVQTPRGLVHLGGAGRYEIAVGSTDQPTQVTVVDGSAQIEGPNLSLQVAAGQTATITGSDSFQGSIGPAIHDGFLSARLNAERPAPIPAGVPAQVALMPGGSDLYGVGNWSDAPDYGHVWYPPVSAGWVPYRQGHWAYVAPWGWTWIDDAPWGFAPFHYGRWLEIGGRWAWTPGAPAVAQPPVYAPALVTFIGIGAGVALGAALASGSIGWVPLGPREPYRPWYHASDRYMREVNVNHVTNISNNTVTINNYVNRAAATSVPAAVMMGSRPVQGVARPVSAQEFAQARPIIGQQPLRPGVATAGVTPIVARQLNLPTGALPRSAPGPTVRVQAPGSAGSGFSRPGLVPGGRPGLGNAAAQPVPGVAPSPAEPGRHDIPGGPGGRPVPGVVPPRPGVPGPIPGAAPNVAAPNRPGEPMRGDRPMPGVTPNAAAPGRSGVPVPGMPAPGTPVPGAPSPPVPGPAPNALQPNRQPFGRPPGEPGYQGGPAHGGPPAAAVARPAPPQMMQHPAPGPAPAPMAVPRPAPQAGPAPRPEPRFAAPPPPPMRPAAPPPVRPAAPPPVRPAAPPPVRPAERPPQSAARPAPPTQPQGRPAPAPHEKNPNDR